MNSLTPEQKAMMAGLKPEKNSRHNVHLQLKEVKRRQRAKSRRKMASLSRKRNRK